MFFNKERQIVQSIEEYLAEMAGCVAAMEEAFGIYFREGPTAAYDQQVKASHVHEHRADEIRREVEDAMYRKALIPESRGDIMEMLEALDLVVNACDNLVDAIWIEQLRIPGELYDDLRMLIAANVEAVRLLDAAVRALFHDVKNAPDAARRVSTAERQSDHLERLIIKAVFRSDADAGNKVLLRDIVLRIGEVSDSAEAAADRLRVIGVKRLS